jgi:hypothetical protein
MRVYYDWEYYSLSGDFLSLVSYFMSRHKVRRARQFEASMNIRFRRPKLCENHSLISFLSARIRATCAVLLVVPLH